MTDNISNIRVLIFRENDMWIAECLEYNLMSQGKNLKEAQKSFCKMLVSQIIIDTHHNIEPLSLSARNKIDAETLLSEYQESQKIDSTQLNNDFTHLMQGSRLDGVSYGIDPRIHA